MALALAWNRRRTVRAGNSRPVPRQGRTDRGQPQARAVLPAWRRCPTPGGSQRRVRGASGGIWRVYSLLYGGDEFFRAHRFFEQDVTLRGPGRQADQIAADNKGLGPELRGAIGEIDAVAVRQQPISDHDFVSCCFQICHCRRGGLNRVDGIPRRTQDVAQQLAAGRLILDQEYSGFGHLPPPAAWPWLCAMAEGQRYNERGCEKTVPLETMPSRQMGWREEAALSLSHSAPPRRTTTL